MTDPVPEKKLTENQLQALKRLGELDGRDYTSEVGHALLGLTLPPVGGFAFDLIGFIEGGQRSRERDYLLDVINGKSDMDVDRIQRIVNPELWA